jgi:hypothetical protein
VSCFTQEVFVSFINRICNLVWPTVNGPKTKILLFSLVTGRAFLGHRLPRNSVDGPLNKSGTALWTKLILH